MNRAIGDGQAIYSTYLPGRGGSAIRTCNMLLHISLL